MTALGRRLYLDHNAGAPLLPEARDAVVRALDAAGNPSSVHAEGRAARRLVDEARRQVARLVGADPAGVVFTSGASEAASTCLTPDWLFDGRPMRLERMAVLDTDHPCIREGGRFEARAVCRLPVDRDGIVDREALTSWLDRDGAGLLALTLANSETGTIQPVREIVAAARRAGALVVLDAVQMAGRLPLDLAALGADALILSGHKIGAPKGVGAFVLAETARRPVPLITGGAQETRQRAGTEAVALIAGFGAAAEVAATHAADAERLFGLRSRLEAGLLARDPAIVLLGAGAKRLPQTVAIHHPALRAETTQIALDLDGVAVSAGSACSSGRLGPSHVLAALARAGAPIEPEAGALRVSFGPQTVEAEIDLFLAAFGRYLDRTRSKLDGRRAA